MEKHINSNTDALIKRISQNSSKSKIDLDEWILQHLNIPKTKIDILDLGCGTGKQIFNLIPHLSEESSITGFDISEQAVSEVINKARSNGYKNIFCTKGDLDNCLNVFKGNKYDIIISTYAIYYSRNIKKLLIELEKLLKENGKMFISGYGKSSNKEIIDLSNQFISSSANPINQIENFISDTDLAEISKHYNKCETFELNNEIKFHSADDVLIWWRNHSLYSKEIEKNIVKWLRTYFAENTHYYLTKNVFGVKISL